MEEEMMYVLYCSYATDYTQGFYIKLYRDYTKATLDMIADCTNYIKEMVEGNESDWEINLGTKGHSVYKKDDYNRYHSDWVILTQKIN